MTQTLTHKQTFYTNDTNTNKTTTHFIQMTHTLKNTQKIHFI